MDAFLTDVFPLVTGTTQKCSIDKLDVRIGSLPLHSLTRLEEDDCTKFRETLPRCRSGHGIDSAQD